MASPRRTPSVPAGSGNKENISQGGDAPLGFATLSKEGSASTKWKKKPAGFNMRKSIAWNPAFFTEEGVLDNSELSVLTGSQLMPNGSPGSGVSSIMSPSCQSGRYGNTYVKKEVAENSHGKLPARYHSAQNQGRKLFSSVKTPQRDKRKEPVGIPNISSARSIQTCTPRVPAGSIYTQKKVPNSSASRPHMSRTPKQSQPSIPKVPRRTSFVTNGLESHRKVAPVKAELVHRVTGFPPKLKINSVSSGPCVEKDALPAVTATSEEACASVKCKKIPAHPQIGPSSPFDSTGSNFAKPSALRMPSPQLPAVTATSEEACASVKCKKIPAHPQISPSSPFDSTGSNFAKPSALRMPSPSVGFFTQEKAHVSHIDAAKRNMGRCFAANTSALVKPPRYMQSEESKLHLSKKLSTSCTAASNLLVLPVNKKSNPKSLVIPEKESSSKANTTYLENSGNVNNQTRPEVVFLLAGSGATTQPINLEKNDGAVNSIPVVYNEISHVEGRGNAREIEPLDNPCSLEVIYSSTIEPVEDSFALEASCSAIKPIVGSKSSRSCNSSEVCSSSELSCQGKSDSDSSAANHLENSYVREIALGASLSKDQLPHCGSSRDETPALADSHSDLNDSLCNEAKPVSSEEPSTDGGMELEISRDETPALADSHSDLNDSLCNVAKPVSSEEPNTDGGMELEISRDETPALADSHSDLNDSLCNEAKSVSSEEPNTDGAMELETNSTLSVKETPLLEVGCGHIHNYRTTECSPVNSEAPMPCMQRRHAFSVEPNIEDKTVLDTDRSSALQDASHVEKNKALDRSRANTILKDHLKNLVPFTEEWLAVMEARGQEVLEQKTGAVQNSPPDKTAPEPSPWSPVKRKAQDVGPYDCTKYSKSIRTSGT